MQKVFGAQRRFFFAYIFRKHPEYKNNILFAEVEPEVPKLEDLTCAQLKQRLRAINKPVGGRKADLIQRIREHERLTAALFEED